MANRKIDPRTGYAVFDSAYKRDHWRIFGPMVGDLIVDKFTGKKYIRRGNGDVTTFPHGTRALPFDAFKNMRYATAGNFIDLDTATARPYQYTAKQKRRFQRKAKEARDRMVRNNRRSCMNLRDIAGWQFEMKPLHATLNGRVFNPNKINVFGYEIEVTQGDIERGELIFHISPTQAIRLRGEGDVREKNDADYFLGYQWTPEELARIMDRRDRCRKDFENFIADPHWDKKEVRHPYKFTIPDWYGKEPAKKKVGFFRRLIDRIDRWWHYGKD